MAEYKRFDTYVDSQTGSDDAVSEVVVDQYSETLVEQGEQAYRDVLGGLLSGGPISFKRMLRSRGRK